MIFNFLKRKTNSTTVSVPKTPWQDRPSIHEHIQSHLIPSTGKLDPTLDDLPDDAVQFTPGKLRWAAGALDGVFSHHTASDNNEEQAEKVAQLLKAISFSGKESDKIELYNILVGDSLTSYIDRAIALAVKKDLTIHPHLYFFARFLAEKSPDRGAVKFGIALLGLIGEETDKAIVKNLGKHDEFTLFSAVALSNMSNTPEKDLFELAKQVDGWGRIQIVERLAETQDNEIKTWLLHEGFRNSVMNEYLAYICATAGDLKSALSANEIDQVLFNASRDLIEALINGGPARDINDYQDAAEVIASFIRHSEVQKPSTGMFLTLNSIHSYLANEQWNDEQQSASGWTPDNRTTLLSRLNAVLAEPHWQHLINDDLQSEDESVFRQANYAATHCNIDTWAVNWKRLNKSPHSSENWANIMRLASEQTIEQILELAETTIPLDEIATGATIEMGLGPQFHWHHALDYLLQDLNRYPGKGLRLIEAGLKSPTVRNRNMAIKAASSWTTEQLLRLKPTITIAHKQEPDEAVKKRLSELLLKFE